MNRDNYVVTCLKCKGESRLAVLNGKDVMYKDHTPIIAARLRPDLVWGFQCICGNDSRVAPEERDQLNLLVSGGEHAIDKIAESMKIKHTNKFAMEKQ